MTTPTTCAEAAGSRSTTANASISARRIALRLGSSLLGAVLLLVTLTSISPAEAANRKGNSLKARRLAQLGTGTPAVVVRQSTDNADDQRLYDAREAWQKRDRQRLATLKQQLVGQRHPLAAWVDYWEISLRLGEVGQDELEAFYSRWPGSYQEDRLRNDWRL